MPTALQGSPLLRALTLSPRPCKTSPVAHSAPATRASLAGLPTRQAATVPRTFAWAVSSAWNSVPLASTWPTLSHHPGTFLKGLLLHDTHEALWLPQETVNHTHACRRDTLATDCSRIASEPLRWPGPRSPDILGLQAFTCGQNVTTSWRFLLKQTHDRGDSRNVHWNPLTECTNCSFLSMAVSPNLVCPSPGQRRRRASGPALPAPGAPTPWHQTSPFNLVAPTSAAHNWEINAQPDGHLTDI